jgi:glutathione S-transferase
MLKLYHSPLSRSVRIVWLLEELELPYELITLPLEPPAPKPFAQKTPTGKIPTLEDDDTTLFESGAILEYVLEEYGENRLAPAVGSAQRGAYLQWVHFADSTAFVGMGNISWHTRFKDDAESVAEAIADYRRWAEASLDTLQRRLVDRAFLLGAEFSGADIMVGYTVLVGKALGLIGEQHAAVDAYLHRLTERPALLKALRV